MSEQPEKNEVSKKIEAERLKDIQQKFVNYCAEVNIDAEIKTVIDSDDTYVQVQIPNGREKRAINYFRVQELEKAIEIALEKFVFIGDYAAIADYEAKTIEAVITFDNMSSFLFERFINTEEDNKGAPILLKKENSDIQIEISKMSDAMILLSPRNIHLRKTGYSVKISGIKINTHDEALDILQRFTNSLFFQIELHNEMLLSLANSRRPYRYRSRKAFQENSYLEFPKVEFDDAPIALYRYARNATSMPLLQFLAFYQVVEYYYPIYSQDEAKKRIRTILKDPRFRGDRDADIGRILSLVTGKGRGLGDEKSQLLATINACIDPNNLREFFNENSERAEFFLKKQKGLTDCKIPINVIDADLRNSITDLIYDIRCKIVHTKAEGSDELLLPFSKESELLFHDIELIQYVARQVLISASTPLSI